MAKNYQIGRQFICLIISILCCTFSRAAEYPLSGLGVSEPLASFNSSSPVLGSDDGNFLVIDTIPVNYSVPLATLIPKIPSWTLGFGQSPYYQLKFIPNINFAEVLGSYQNRSIIRINRNLAYSLEIKDAVEAAVGINDPSQSYCIVKSPSNCTEGDYKAIGDNDSIGLTFTIKLFYLGLDKDNSHYFDPNSDEPVLEAGTISLGKFVLTKMQCPIFGGCSVLEDSANFDLKLSYSVLIKPQTCYLDTSQLSQIVPMGKVTIAELNQTGSVQAAEPINFDFNCPKISDVEVSMQIKDLNNPNNQSTILSLSEDSTAVGVGVGLMDSNNQPIQLSPSLDGKTGSTVQFHSNYQPTIHYQLWPYFVKQSLAGEVQAGTVKAAAQFRFDYK